jgi:hypothetical protein
MDSWEKIQAQDGKTNDPRDASNYGHFAGYINGVADTLWTSQSVCMPEGTTYDQMYAVVAKYLKANPERWHLSPFLLTSAALKEGFPCKKKNK